ncbi:hypothetical protein [Streptomyces boluensis]|uniref:Chitinase n=1 Tax=Streptomyces boluensis TaxID=1775135 RepID=A0A964USK4_9ACTN|nr:hypothetical protein [Streptomyces boluensis]NBE54663.1 hypothetical protein [Streptomyces boluensis]
MLTTSLGSLGSTGIAAKFVRLCALGAAATALAGTAALASNANAGAGADASTTRTTAGTYTTDDLIWG